MKKLAWYLIVIFILFALVISSFIFVSSEFEKQIRKTENEINGVLFAKKVQSLIVKLQLLRGYGQFTEDATTDTELQEIASEKEQINLSLQQDIAEFKEFKVKFPSLYDDEYSYILDTLRVLKQKNAMGPAELFQKYTHLITRLKEKFYHLGIASELFFEEESESYYLMDILFDHLPNYIEAIARLRGETSRYLLQKDLSQNLTDSISNSCYMCENERSEIKKIIDVMHDHNQKMTFSTNLTEIESNLSELRKYIKKTINGEAINITALVFFKKASLVVDQSKEMYEMSTDFLLQKLQSREQRFKSRQQYSVMAVVLFVLLMSAILYFMVRNTRILMTREEAEKEELIATNNLKTVLLQCNTLEEMSVKALTFLAEKSNAFQGMIYLYSEENDKLYLSATYAAEDADPIVEMGEGTVGQIALTKKNVCNRYPSMHIEKESIAVTPSTVCTFPFLSSNQLVAVVELSFLSDKQKCSIDDAEHFIEIIIGFLRDALHEQNNQKQLELLDKNVMTSKTNKEGVIIDISALFASVSGYTKDELIGKNHNILKHSDTPVEVYQEMWTTLLSGREWRGEIKNRKKDGSDYWIETLITPDRDNYGNILGFSAVIHEITDKKRVEKISITDALTGLYNRHFFDITYPRIFKSAKREKRGMVFLMMDIDFFKQYNDTYGHQKGDEALRSVAEVMNEQFTRPDDYLFRLGGEEFGALYYSDNLESAYKMAETVNQQVVELKIDHEQNSASPYLTISIGLFFIPADCHLIDLDEIYKAADDALYRAKESGRNCIELVESTIC